MKYMLPLVVLLVFAGSQSQAQQITEQAISAFSASYAAEAAKDYTKAINDLSAVYSEGFYEVNLRLGWLHYQKKEYDQSQKYYRQAIKDKPNSIEAMLAFVNPASVVKNWGEIFSIYQKILAIDPENSSANYRIAIIYYYRKEFATAEKHLQNIIDRYPFDYDIVLLMAQVKLAQSKMSESKVYYQRALLYNPSNTEIKAMINKL